MSTITWPIKAVAGLSCEDVLDRLSDYLDGELPAPSRAAVEEHVKACDGCARFGGEFKSTVRALRDHLLRSPAPPARLVAKLREALDRELDRD